MLPGQGKDGLGLEGPPGMKRASERDKMPFRAQRAAPATVWATGPGCSGGNEMKITPVTHLFSFSEHLLDPSALLSSSRVAADLTLTTSPRERAY